jgi:uncharacterized membrane protein YphA (DoxX/SURF4 family)
MNIVLWVLQVGLALHTIMGAVWKFSNTEESVGSLRVIPHPVWLGLSVVELGAAACLVLPFVVSSMGALAPVAAVVIAAEMIVFSAIHLQSGESNNSPVVYWMVVAVFCAFIAYGRFVLRPL